MEKAHDESMLMAPISDSPPVTDVIHFGHQHKVGFKTLFSPSIHQITLVFRDDCSITIHKKVDTDTEDKMLFCSLYLADEAMIS